MIEDKIKEEKWKKMGRKWEKTLKNPLQNYDKYCMNNENILLNVFVIINLIYASNFQNKIYYKINV